MTKTDLYNQLTSAGWVVQPVASWLKVSEVVNKRKFDVNVVSPSGIFSTGQVIVTDDGLATEAAEAAGSLVTPPNTFAQDLRAFLDTKEGGAVYAIAVTKIYESDEVAEAIAYSNVTGGVSAVNYVVKRRSGAFDFQKLI